MEGLDDAGRGRSLGKGDIKGDLSGCLLAKVSGPCGQTYLNRRIYRLIERRLKEDGKYSGLKAVGI